MIKNVNEISEQEAMEQLMETLNAVNTMADSLMALNANMRQATSLECARELLAHGKITEDDYCDFVTRTMNDLGYSYDVK